MSDLQGIRDKRSLEGRIYCGAERNENLVRKLQAGTFKAVGDLCKPNIQLSIRAAMSSHNLRKKSSCWFYEQKVL